MVWDMADLEEAATDDIAANASGSVCCRGELSVCGTRKEWGNQRIAKNKWPVIWWYNNSTLCRSTTVRLRLFSRLGECAFQVAAQSEVHCVQNCSIFKAL
jgi:hypothetical protein